MRVWIGYIWHSNDECGWRDAVKVFDDEAKALIWKEEVEPYDYGAFTEWRDYQDFEVE